LLGGGRRAKLITIAVLALLGAFALQAFLSAAQKSPTMDEQYHIARGYAYLRTGDLRLSREHPPLINTISALPLLIIRPQLPVEHPSWESADWPAFSDELLWHATDTDDQPIETQKIVNWARVPIVLLGLLLGIGVFAWASELHGPSAGLLALALYVFSPNILAHTRLATNDLGLTCFMFLALYTFWRFVTGPTMAGAIVAGVALGLALVAKFSAVILLPILTLLFVVYAWHKSAIPRSTTEPDLRPLSANQATTSGMLATAELSLPTSVRPASPPWWRTVRWKWVLYLAVLAIAGLVVVWSIYGLECGPLSEGGMTLPMPSYWRGLQAIFERTQRGHSAFLMGQYSTSGWWYYFPVAFFIKTPPSMLLLVALTLALTIYRQSWRVEMWLLLPVAMYFIALVSSPLNIGYRHLLPILPLLFVYVSGLASDSAQFSIPSSKLGNRLTQFIVRNGLGVIVVALVGWQAHTALSIYPHYLAYFNQIVGGPENGWRYLVDSNIDWGQDLPGLRAYVEARGLERVYLSWFGNALPERYGMDYVPLPSWPLFAEERWHRVYHPQRPAPGVYAISATHLQGVYLSDPDTYAWFREREPTAKIGYSIFIYDVPRVGGGAVSIALSGMSIDQIDTQTFDTAFGTNDLSLRWFDAPDVLVLPVGGLDTWFLSAGATPLDPSLQERFFADAVPWERRQTLGDGRPYTLYRLGADEIVRLATPAQTGETSVWWSPAVAFPPSYERYPLSLPVDFDHSLAFLGYELTADRLRPGDELRLLTFWRVERPFEPPLTLFVHLLDAEGQVRGQRDGLSADPVGMESGDVFVQVHRFPVPPDAPPGEYQLEVGVYRPDTMHRWSVYEAANAVADRLLLYPVSVKEK